MSMAVEMAARKNLKNVERAAARRRKALGIEPQPAVEELSEVDRNSALGRAVRIEVDVCIPLAELKKNLLSVRNEVTNALAALETFPVLRDKLHAVHWALGRAKAEIYYRKREREVRDTRKPQP